MITCQCTRVRTNWHLRILTDRSSGSVCSRRAGLSCMAHMQPRRVVCQILRRITWQGSLHRRCGTKSTTILTTSGIYSNPPIDANSPSWQPVSAKANKKIQRALSLAMHIRLFRRMSLYCEMRKCDCSSLGTRGVRVNGRGIGPITRKNGRLSSECFVGHRWLMMAFSTYHWRITGRNTV